MVPETAKKPIPRRCPICDKKLISKEALVNHIDKHHEGLIPDNWSAARYENFLRTGVKCGNCTECGEPTEWNDSTWKYNRHCGSPKCIKSIASRAKKNMISKHGVVHKLNDPEMQRKMIYSKRNSGSYYFSSDEDKKYKIMYASSQEKNFLEMLDVFLNMDPSDIMGPSPHTYTYKYEGKDHFYIPDYYISSLNLEIEIKEPLDNQNKHPKIQAVDKVKEGIKDELMKSIEEVNYIKINGTDYRQFFTFLYSLKDMDDTIYHKPVVRGTVESMGSDSVLETTNTDLLSMVEKYNDLFKIMMAVKQPGFNFKSVINTLQKHIQTCKKGDIAYVENELNQVENELHEISIKRPQDVGAENVYEATKALKVVRERLRPMLEAKKRALMESVIYMEDSEVNYNIPYIEASNISAYKNGRTYRPVFVVLTSNYTPMGIAIRNITKQPYTHACISLDTTMNNLATFNAFVSGGKRGGGFTPSESFKFGGYTDPRSTYAIYMYLAPQEEFMTMTELIDQFKENANKFNYSFRGCVDYLFNRKKTYSGEYFCSEFVADILKNANPKLLDKDSHFYSPGDLANTRKLRFVISGKCVEYDSHKTDRKVAKILKDRGMQGVEIN